MPKAVKVCKVCGKKYEACKTTYKNPQIFRWQDVACSPECGEIYFKQIEASRSGSKATVSATFTITTDDEKGGTASITSVDDAEDESVDTAAVATVLDVPAFQVSITPSDNHTSDEAIDD